MSEITLESIKNRFASDSIRMGFIGCGPVARFHADVFRELGVSIASLCATRESDRSERFRNEYGNPRFFTNVEAMLDAGDINALCVLGSWKNQDQFFAPVFKRKIPSLFEKPVSLKSSAIREALAHPQAESLIQVGYNRRFYGCVAEARRFIARSQLRAIEVRIPESLSDDTDSEYRANVFLSNSSHVIDLVFFLLGKSVWRQLAAHRLSDSAGRSSGFTGYFDVDGLPLLLMAKWNAPANFGVTLHSDTESFDLTPVELGRHMGGFTVVDPTPQVPIRRYLPKTLKEFMPSPIDTRFKAGFLMQAIDFIECFVLKKRKTETAATLRDALAVTEICENLMKVDASN